MANPRQRRKSRSGTHTGPSRRSKREMQKKLVRAPTVKGPEILKNSWDPKLTVRQNYAKLGLVSSLDISAAGGVEDLDSYKVPTEFQKSSSSQTFGNVGNEDSNQATSSASTSTSISTSTSTLPSESKLKTKKPKKGMGRIVRDSEGNVVDVVEGESESDSEESHPKSNPWGKLKEGGDDNKPYEAQLEESRELLKMSKFPEPTRAGSGVESKVLNELMALERSQKPVPRHTSLGRHEWLKDLIERYDEDYSAMAKDPTLNLYQKTEGEIKRSIKKAGGKSQILKGFENQR